TNPQQWQDFRHFILQGKPVPMLAIDYLLNFLNGVGPAGTLILLAQWRIRGRRTLPRLGELLWAIQGIETLSFLLMGVVMGFMMLADIGARELFFCSDFLLCPLGLVVAIRQYFHSTAADYWTERHGGWISVLLIVLRVYTIKPHWLLP